LKGYIVNAYSYTTLEIIDNYAAENKDIFVRRFIGTYDTEIYRNYEMLNESIVFIIKVCGDSTGWRGNEKQSEIMLKFIRIEDCNINPDKKLTKEEKILYDKAVAKIEGIFINPIREVINAKSPNWS